MLKKLSVVCIMVLGFFAIAGNVKAQSMYFCESVSSDGYAQNESSVFNISSNGGYLDVLVKLPYALNCSSVRYELYLNGVYETTIYQDAKTNWEWFFQKITFYKAGTWQIYCIDCNDATLASGSLTIQFN